MVENKLINDLMYTGLSEYESKAYVALIGSSPASAYEVAKRAGIPTSKVYEVMARLEQRGIAALLEDTGKSMYVPQEPEDYLSIRRHMMEKTLENLEGGLLKVRKKSETSIIWNITDYDSLMDKALAMAGSAKNSLLLSVWEQEASELAPSLVRARRLGVRVATLHFGPVTHEAGTHDAGVVYIHPIQHTLMEEKGGRGIVIVADSKEALVGTIREDMRADGASSRNEGFVSMAEDYIKHDIYMMKVVSRFDPQLKERFGPGYEKLRNVFADEEY